MTLAKVLPTTIVIRSTVAPAASYADYRDAVRRDFWYSCGYCTMAETESQGISFEIEHYVPTSADETKTVEFENLIWACAECNDQKTDLVVPPSAQTAGWAFFRPDRHEFFEHFSVKDVRLEGKTNIGTWSTTVLNLNRLTLRRIRKIRRDWYSAEQATIIGLRGLASLPIDRLSPQAKQRVAEIVAELKRDASALNGMVTDAVAMALARSEQVDEDPEREAQSAARRRLLKELDAVYPDPWRGRHLKKK